MGGGASAWGLRSLADTFLRYWQPGLPVYLRYQEQVNVAGDYSALGFMPSLSGNNAPTGFTDVLIDPPPDVTEISLHNIGIFGGSLHFGAKIFIVSDLFVQNIMAKLNYTDARMVWVDEQVMGLYYDGRLYTILSITHEDVGGQTTLWKLVCNASENMSPSS
jgi:hypothetical protein